MGYRKFEGKNKSEDIYKSPDGKTIISVTATTGHFGPGGKNSKDLLVNHISSDKRMV